MESFWTYFEVLAPSVGVALLFWFAIRAIFRADRKERAMEAKIREEVVQQHTDPEDDGDAQGSPSSDQTTGNPRRTSS